VLCATGRTVIWCWARATCQREVSFLSLNCGRSSLCANDGKQPINTDQITSTQSDVTNDSFTATIILQLAELRLWTIAIEKCYSIRPTYHYVIVKFNVHSCNCGSHKRYKLMYIKRHSYIARNRRKYTYTFVCYCCFCPLFGDFGLHVQLLYLTAIRPRGRKDVNKLTDTLKARCTSR